MENMAGRDDCDRYIAEELRRCGIETVTVTRCKGEVPYSIVGKLGDLTLHRAWYYWIVMGKVPLAIAQELYADEVGQTDIRVAGHAGRPAPEHPWVEYFDKDGIRLLPNPTEPLNDEQKRCAEELGCRHVDNPEEMGQPYVTSYHIDTEIGLRIFADTIKRHAAAA